MVQVTNGVRGEPGKQKPRNSLFASAYGIAGAGIWPEAVLKNERQEKGALLNREGRYGIDRAM